MSEKGDMLSSADLAKHVPSRKESDNETSEEKIITLMEIVQPEKLIKRSFIEALTRRGRSKFGEEASNEKFPEL